MKKVNFLGISMNAKLDPINIWGKSMAHVKSQVWQLKRIQLSARTGFQTEIKYILSVFFKRTLYLKYKMCQFQTGSRNVKMSYI